MKYKYSTTVKNNDVLRESFNKLTRSTFGFDFSQWYARGHWGECYIPHVLLDGEKVISNVSVNLMQFDIGGVEKNYIQLGTVMTDSAYRNQGLNREIMEHILDEYVEKADGIYLFANDEVLSYYPKFGFKPAKEYEYYMQCKEQEKIAPYLIEKVDMTDEKNCLRLYSAIQDYFISPEIPNRNDAMYMNRNLGLYQFWMAFGYDEHIFYLPEVDIYVIAETNKNTLLIHQIFGKQQADMIRLSKSFGEHVDEMVLGFSPVQKELFLVRERKEEDCTLFILGEDLQCIEREKRMFPVLSHA